MDLTGEKEEPPFDEKSRAIPSAESVYTSDIHHPIQLSNIGERINIWTAQKEYPKRNNK